MSIDDVVMKPPRIQDFRSLSDHEIDLMVAKELGEPLDPLKSYTTDLIIAFRLAALEFITIKNGFAFDTWLATPTPYHRVRDNELGFVPVAIVDRMKSQNQWRDPDNTTWSIEALHPARAVCLTFLIIRGVLEFPKQYQILGDHHGVNFNRDTLLLYHQRTESPPNLSLPKIDALRKAFENELEK